MPRRGCQLGVGSGQDGGLGAQAIRKTAKDAEMCTPRRLLLLPNKYSNNNTGNKKPTSFAKSLRSPFVPPLSIADDHRGGNHRLSQQAVRRRQSVGQTRGGGEGVRGGRHSRKISKVTKPIFIVLRWLRAHPAKCEKPKSIAKFPSRRADRQK